MDLNLKGKNALVTGGSHGIGLAIAHALADEGCCLAICARDKERLEQVTVELEKKHVVALGIPADVLRPSDIKKVVKMVIDNLETIDILVNNVGGGGRWGTSSPETTSEEIWMDVYQKNAMAAVRFTMLAIPLMRKQKWGRVVTIASIYGKEGGGRPWFNMSKSAEISLMKTLAMNPDLARDGITFNSVAPGNIMIPGTGWEEEMKKDLNGFQRMVNSLPMGRLGTPEEVASMVVFLCSEKASLVNGACIAVDGGESRSF